MRRAQLLIVLSGLLLISGLAGVAVGGTSAQAGWWLAVVSGLFLLVGIAAVRAGRAT